LINVAKNCFDDESIVLFKNKGTNCHDKPWMKSIIDTDIYKCLWIHRWISIQFLSKMYNRNKDKEFKENLRTLIYFTDNFIPGRLKKLNFDLSNINLARTNLAEADLKNANLEFTDLSGANLEGADLMGANLSYSNMFTCNLTRASLQYTNFRLSHLIKSNLYNTDLTYTNLVGANLQFVDLRKSIMKESNLQFANLNGVDLSNSDMSLSKLIDINEFTNLECQNTIFKNAITNNEHLFRYLKEEKNVSDPPKLVIDKVEINRYLHQWNSVVQTELENLKFSVI
jgi:uncharacterized protein YjbI with pentapeptide repeats